MLRVIRDAEFERLRWLCVDQKHPFDSWYPYLFSDIHEKNDDKKTPHIHHNVFAENVKWTSAGICTITYQNHPRLNIDRELPRTFELPLRLVRIEFSIKPLCRPVQHFEDVLLVGLTIGDLVRVFQKLNVQSGLLSTESTGMSEYLLSHAQEIDQHWDSTAFCSRSCVLPGIGFYSPWKHQFYSFPEFNYLYTSGQLSQDSLCSQVVYLHPKDLQYTSGWSMMFNCQLSHRWFVERLLRYLLFGDKIEWSGNELRDLLPAKLPVILKTIVKQRHAKSELASTLLRILERREQQQQQSENSAIWKGALEFANLNDALGHLGTQYMDHLSSFTLRQFDPEHDLPRLKQQLFKWRRNVTSYFQNLQQPKIPVVVVRLRKSLRSTCKRKRTILRNEAENDAENYHEIISAKKEEEEEPETKQEEDEEKEEEEEDEDFIPEQTAQLFDSATIVMTERLDLNDQKQFPPLQSSSKQQEEQTSVTIRDTAVTSQNQSGWLSSYCIVM
jgi:hypothetical protein